MSLTIPRTRFGLESHWLASRQRILAHVHVLCPVPTIASISRLRRLLDPKAAVHFAPSLTDRDVLGSADDTSDLIAYLCSGSFFLPPPPSNLLRLCVTSQLLSQPATVNRNSNTDGKFHREEAAAGGSKGRGACCSGEEEEYT